MNETTTSTAKIVRFHKTGPAEVLQFDDLPVPDPGPDEVRMRVKAIGLNRAEIMFREGHYFEQPILPARIGNEAAGVIDAVGSGVDASWIGKNVSTIPGRHSYNQHGVYGEVAILPHRRITEYPSSLTFEEAAAVWNPYITAYGALIWLGKLSKSHVVVIPAASSSVGLAAINIVKAEGATSIAVTRTAAKRASLLEAGASHVIVTDEEDLVAKVNEITSGKGARIIFDPVGGQQFEALASAASPKGIIFLYGGLAMMEVTPLPIVSMVSKQLTIRGYSVGELTVDADYAAAKQYVFDRLASGTFRPNIAKIFPFADFVEAHQYMESNQQIGKIVVSV
jgi:NADPH:quinone reductase-like Zn-dependent oxidoreductase